jgi:hypothetical protein
MIQELMTRGYNEELATNMYNKWIALNKDIFDIQGYFYNIDELKFRRFIEIKRKGINLEKNDLSLVMMNPGSSRPKHYDEINNFEYLNNFVEAFSDETIEQIMRIMDNNNLNYAKIVNLSDIRNAKSEIFYEMLNTVLQNYDHSIFSETNKHFLSNYLNSQSLFIFAWGVDTRLNNLSTQAIKVIKEMYGNNIVTIGIKHKKNLNGYYHALPQKQLDQIIWVENISDMIRNCKRANVI